MFGIEELTRSTKCLEVTLERLTSKLDTQNMLIMEQTNLYKDRGLKNTKKLLQEIRDLKSKKEVNKFIDKIILDFEEQMK